MKPRKVRSRQSLSWTRHLLSSRSPSAMWALDSVPELMVGNLSPDRPRWRIYLQSVILTEAGLPRPSEWPRRPLKALLDQSFSSRSEALEAIEDFAAIYRQPPGEAGAQEARAEWVAESKML